MRACAPSPPPARHLELTEQDVRLRVEDIAVDPAAHARGQPSPRASQATCCTRYGFVRGTAKPPELRVHVETEEGPSEPTVREGEIGVGADAPRHVQAGGFGPGVRREPVDAPRQPLRVEGDRWRDAMVDGPGAPVRGDELVDRDGDGRAAARCRQRTDGRRRARGGGAGPGPIRRARREQRAQGQGSVLVPPSRTQGRCKVKSRTATRRGQSMSTPVASARSARITVRSPSRTSINDAAARPRTWPVPPPRVAAPRRDRSARGRRSSPAGEHRPDMARDQRRCRSPAPPR